MFEDFVIGASCHPGTENASHFNHQTPGMDSLDDDIDPPSPHDDRRNNARHSSLPVLEIPAPMPSHAHLPSEMSPLKRRIETTQSLESESPISPAIEENDYVPENRRGLWQNIKDFWTDLKDDFGPAESQRTVTNLIGDTGIDVQTLKKLRHGSGLSSLVGSSLLLSGPGLGMSDSRKSSFTPSLASTETGSVTPSTLSRFQPGIDPKEVSKALHKLKNKIGHSKETKEAKYVQAKSDLAARRTLALLLTYALMLYGAPSHRLEEYILALFKICNLDGRVNYIVGCTEICFINPPDPADPMTRVSYTTLVKAQGLDVGALECTFRIYKDVVHGEISIEEATKKLIELVESPPWHKPWVLVPFYGLASAFACVWAYNGYWSDMGIAFPLGCIVGLLQVIVAARNSLYANVLEVTSALITSFLARAFATIGGPDQKYFCFAAIAESSITTILPGYIVLCGALELQSKSVTAGSTRLFYAVMYSLFLGYGIDVGSQLWAVVDSNAPTSAVCPRSVDPKWKLLLVPCYLALQATLIGSRPRQIPIQVLFGSIAYTVNFFVSKYATAQVADTASAFTLGILGHLYARSRHAFAFASVVAGIMVLVPSALSAQGGLIAGLSTPLFNNGSTNAQQIYEQNIYQSFSVGAQMIQVAVGLSVGLFVSALAIYPLGRKNNALFSF